MNNAYHLKASQMNQSFVYLFLLFPSSPPDTMASLAMLRIILAQHDIQKLILPSGIPLTRYERNVTHAYTHTHTHTHTHREKKKKREERDTRIHTHTHAYTHTERETYTDTHTHSHVT